MFVAEIAPEVDRLVWTVNYGTADSSVYREAFAKAGIGDVGFVAIANYVPALSAGPVREDILLRRYRYSPPGGVRSLIARLVDAGCLVALPEGYAATDRFGPVMASVSEAFAFVAESTWIDHDERVSALSGLVRRVLDTAPDSPLLVAYRDAVEPESPFGLLHQRLTILRVIRNEAHAAAWAARGLSAADMVSLTALWNGEDLEDQTWAGPPHFVSDGSLTDAGHQVRDEIEADTNRRNEPAFAALDAEDRTVFLDAVTNLPGTPP